MASTEKEKLIKELCNIREKLHILIGRHAKIERLKKTLDKAFEELNAVLYGLTSDEFYKAHKEY